MERERERDSRESISLAHERFGLWERCGTKDRKCGDTKLSV